MPAPLLIAFCALCGSYCVKKFHDVFSKKEKNKKRKIDLKGKTIDQAREDNKLAREEEKKTREALEEQERKNKELGKELEQARNKVNDPNLSEEERASWRRKIVVLEEQLNNGQGESKSLSNHLKKLTERIKNNNKTISDTTSSSDNKNWIWDLFTLENIMIGVAMYVGYKLLKEDKK